MIHNTQGLARKVSPLLYATEGQTDSVGHDDDDAISTRPFDKFMFDYSKVMSDLLAIASVLNQAFLQPC